MEAAKRIRVKHKVSGCLQKRLVAISPKLMVNINSRIQFLNLITISIIITLLRLISRESDGQYVISL